MGTCGGILFLLCKSTNDALLVNGFDCYRSDLFYIPILVRFALLFTFGNTSGLELLVN